MRSDLARRMTVWWAGVLCLPFLVMALHPGPMFAAEKGATLQQRLESATVVRTFDTEGAEVHQFKTAKDLVVFLLWKQDSSVVVAYGLDGTRRFRFGMPDTTFRRLKWVNVSEDGITLVVAEAVRDEEHRFRVFDVDGGLRFQVTSSADIRPSPTGRFFLRAFVPSSTEPMAIFDAAGRLTWEFPRRQNEWNCKFVGDSSIVLADPDTLWIVQTLTGIVTRSTPLEFPNSRSAPCLSVSSSTSLIAVFNSAWLLLISPSGRELWREPARDYLCSAAIDQASSRVVLQLRDSNATYGYLRSLPISRHGPIVESPRFPILAASALDDIGSMTSRAHTTAICGPPTASLTTLEPATRYWTLFINLDESDTRATSSIVIDGLFVPVAYPTPTTTQSVYFAPPTYAALVTRQAGRGLGR